MPSRDDRAHRTNKRIKAVFDRFADEIRSARLNQGKGQATAAEEAGIDRGEWSRIESGKRTRVTLDLAVRMAMAVGLDLVINLYRSDRVTRDIAHLRLLADLRALLGPDWTWRYEVPIGQPPDQRAWDAVAQHSGTGLTIRVEAETRLYDVQSILRKVEGKRVTDGEPRLLLALRDSRANRLAVRSSREVLDTAFPARQRTAMARLRAGQDPGADMLFMVDWLRAEKSPPAAPGPS